jgi:hypothetical protein
MLTARCRKLLGSHGHRKTQGIVEQTMPFFYSIGSILIPDPPSLIAALIFNP